ncbi:hypothetical protein ACUXKQ_002586, partial [Staphylococcus cohnii]
NILVKLFISEVVHTEDSFLLKLYYKFNFATEPQILKRSNQTKKVIKIFKQQSKKPQNIRLSHLIF